MIYLNEYNNKPNSLVINKIEYIFCKIIKSIEENAADAWKTPTLKRLGIIQENQLNISIDVLFSYSSYPQLFLNFFRTTNKSRKYKYSKYILVGNSISLYSDFNGFNNTYTMEVSNKNISDLLIYYSLKLKYKEIQNLIKNRILLTRYLSI